MKSHAFTRGWVAIAAVAAVVAGASASRAEDAPGARPVESRLVASNRGRVPTDPAEVWIAPERALARAQDPVVRAVVTAIKQQAKGEYAKSLPALTAPGVARTPLADYASYYAGVAQLRLDHASEARKAFQVLQTRPLVGYLYAAAALGEAEAAEELGDHTAAVGIYERLLAEKLGSVEELLMRVGRAARAAGDTTKAGQAFTRVYYEFATSEDAASAAVELGKIPGLALDAVQRMTLERARADRLFNARQYAPARNAFEMLRNATPESDRGMLDLRIAECDYFLKRPKATRDGIRQYLAHPPVQAEAEALYYLGAAQDDLGDAEGHEATMRQVVEKFPTTRWAEQALDHLATSQILQDDDEAADATFRQLYERYPTGAYAERAAWKIGWRAYRAQRYDETARLYERAAADFPHSDFRPAWLYWAGVAHEQLGDRTIADARYLLTAADYLNSYYGRLATVRLMGRQAVPRLVTASAVAEPQPEAVVPPPNAGVIRMLLALELYDDALNELRFAERVTGSSALTEATISWVHQKQGQFEAGSRRFNLVRGAITSMRRAYPQFMASGGEALPREIQTVIFPLAYWDMIRAQAAEHDLDPFLVAALVAQESTFVPDIKSYAKAVGLMQLMPATARQYAKRVGIKYTSSTLTNPEANIKLGTAYFADKIREFGDASLALASYNAGEGAVHRWMNERPGLPRDEFVDDIPYPQTQNYVKRIMGTAEDYRRLYADGVEGDELLPVAKVAKVAQGVGAPPAPGSPASKPTQKRLGAKKSSASKSGAAVARKKAPSKRPASKKSPKRA